MSAESLAWQRQLAQADWQLAASVARYEHLARRLRLRIDRRRNDVQTAVRQVQACQLRLDRLAQLSAQREYQLRLHEAEHWMSSHLAQGERV